MKGLFQFMVVVLPLLLLLAQRPVNLKPITITGTVVDEATGAPLEYGTLIFKRVRNPERVTGGITDINGKFEIAIPPGQFCIGIEDFTSLL